VIGKIVMWDEARRFGFIRVGYCVPDFIFFKTGLLTPVQVGDECDFWLHDNPQPKTFPLIAAEVAARNPPGDVAASAVVPRLYVRGIPRHTDATELWVEVSRQAGPVRSLRRKDGDSFGFLDLVDGADAHDVLAGSKSVVIGDSVLTFRLPRAGNVS